MLWPSLRASTGQLCEARPFAPSGTPRIRVPRAVEMPMDTITFGDCYLVAALHACKPWATHCLSNRSRLLPTADRGAALQSRSATRRSAWVIRIHRALTFAPAVSIIRPGRHGLGRIALRTGASKTPQKFAATSLYTKKNFWQPPQSRVPRRRMRGDLNPCVRRAKPLSFWACGGELSSIFMHARIVIERLFPTMRERLRQAQIYLIEGMPTLHGGSTMSA